MKFSAASVKIPNYANIEDEVVRNAFDQTGKMVEDLAYLVSLAINANENLGIALARVTVDQSVVSSAVLVDATGMSFAIAAGEEWVSHWLLDFGDALDTPGLRVAITTPASATQDISVGSVPSTVTGADVIGGRTTTSGAAIAFTGAQTTYATGHMSILAWVLAGATAGNVQLQFAQGTNSATPTVLHKGSFMVAHRVA